MFLRRKLKAGKAEGLPAKSLFPSFSQVAAQNFLSVALLQLALKKREGSQCIPKEFLTLSKKRVHQKPG